MALLVSLDTVDSPYRSSLEFLPPIWMGDAAVPRARGGVSLAPPIAPPLPRAYQLVHSQCQLRGQHWELVPRALFLFPRLDRRVALEMPLTFPRVQLW